MVSRVALLSCLFLVAAGYDFSHGQYAAAGSPLQGWSYRTPGAALRNTFSPYSYPGYRTDDVREFGYDTGTYRTLCVRLCDGFYFPISFSTRSGGFVRDADRCTARCGEQGRLFYHPNPGGDVGTMHDLEGRSYSTLPTAFKYRKSVVAGCACRPQPATGEVGSEPALAPRATDAVSDVHTGAPVVQEDGRRPAIRVPVSGRAPSFSRYTWPAR